MVSGMVVGEWVILMIVLLVMVVMVVLFQ